LLLYNMLTERYRSNPKPDSFSEFETLLLSKRLSERYVKDPKPDSVRVGGGTWFRFNSNPGCK
jgi:hypothetical protein